MGGQDKVRIEQHLESLRSIEQRLSPGHGGMPGHHLQGRRPRPTIPKMEFLANDNYPKVGKMHMDLLVASLASDRSRIATLQWSQGNG